MSTLIETYRSNNDKNIDDVYIEEQKELVQKIHKVILGFIIFMTIGVIGMTITRITNLNKSLEFALSKEIRYEQINPNNLNKSDKIIKIAGQKVLIYKETLPKYLTKATNDTNYIYAIPQDSNIITLQKSATNGLFWDILIILSILLTIYKIYEHYYNYLFNKYNEIKNQLKEFREAFTNSKNIENFKNNYDTLGLNINKIKHIGKIWWEFCETLIIEREHPDATVSPNYYINTDDESENSEDYYIINEDVSNPVKTIQNTDQIELYINSENIINKQTNIEVLDSMSGILTGLGLVGTFIAITIALMGFDMGHVEVSIQNLLGGLSIKFISSLAGILTSIGFLYIKSHLFDDMVKSIAEAQTSINHIFPRRTAESCLCKMEIEIKNSTDYLNKLHKIIDDRNQNTSKFLDDMKTKIEEALKNSYTKDIKNILDDVAKKINDGISEKLGKTLNDLIGIMKDVKELKQNVSNDTLTEVKNAIKTKIDGIDITEGLTQGLNTSEAKLEILNKQMYGLADKLDKYITRLENNESNVDSKYSDLLNKIDKALNSQNDFISTNKNYLSDLTKAADGMHQASDKLQGISGSINEATNSLSNSKQILESSQAIVKSISDNSTQLNNQLSTSIKTFNDKAQTSIETIMSTYTTSINKLLGDIQSSVSELSEEKISTLSDNIEELNTTIQNKL